MPHVDMDEVKNGRKAFTKEEWMDILLRSTGMEPDKLSDRAKWLLIARMIPLVENNFNMCELGPRSTGKSYIYEQISPNSILVAGGQTTVANLFYNMSNNTVGLVGMWDVVAFDEVAGIKFKDKDGIQIMKGYMASGAFSRGKAEIQAKASMVFVGNIKQSVETLQKTSSLFDPFPPEMGTDTAFLDRFHAYIPGLEIPKYRPDSFTNDYGFITDYLSEFMRELRKDNYSNIAEKYFKLGNNLNQRDAIAVRKLISGFIKLIYPDEMSDLEDMGYICQPHTSAGRIPTDKGYRFYVDSLMNEKIEAETEKGNLLERVDKMEKMLKQVARVLAANTNYATLVTTPQYNNTVKFIQLSKVAESKLLAVIMVDGNIVKNKLIDTTYDLKNDEILKFNILLNTFLQGAALEDINLELIQTMKMQAGEYADILENIFQGIMEAIHEADDLKVYTSGATNM